MNSKEADRLNKQYEYTKNMNRWIGQMDTTYDPKAQEEYALREQEENAEWYESMKYADKPQEYKDRDVLREQYRRGLPVTELNYPKPGDIFIKMDDPSDTSTIKFADIIGDGSFINRKNPDTNTGVVAKASKTSDYKVGDKVAYDVRSGFYRLSYQDRIHLIMKEESILATL